MLYRTFPHWRERFNQVKDHRKRKHYEVGELVMASVFMHLLRSGSRNGINQCRKEEQFRLNYFRVFKQGFPHLDTVDDFLRALPERELETLKVSLVGMLLKARVLHRFKFMGKFLIAIDGTGTHSFEKDYCGQCLSRTSKKGQVTYLHYVLEAKLVTTSGLAISLASEWVENPQGEYDKQDCEWKAFLRLARKIKRSYPRLPIILLADGLYAKEPLMHLCQAYGWEWMVTLKDDCLKSLRTRIFDELLAGQGRKMEREVCDKTRSRVSKYRFLSGLPYGSHSVNWMECTETLRDLRRDKEQTQRFVYITSLKPPGRGIHLLSDAGRLRWKIENEGFKAQKQQGYALEHKFSRTCFGALKNYYQTLQIAHLFHQLAQHEQSMAQSLQGDAKLTIKYILEKIRTIFCYFALDEEELTKLRERPTQLRLSG